MLPLETRPLAPVGNPKDEREGAGVRRHGMLPEDVRTNVSAEHPLFPGFNVRSHPATGYMRATLVAGGLRPAPLEHLLSFSTMPRVDSR